MHRYAVTDAPTFQFIGLREWWRAASNFFLFHTNRKSILRIYFTFALNLLISVLKRGRQASEGVFEAVQLLGVVSYVLLILHSYF